MHGAVAVVFIVQCPTSTLWIAIAPQNVPRRIYFGLKANQKLRRHIKKTQSVESMGRILTLEERGHKFKSSIMLFQADSILHK